MLRKAASRIVLTLLLIGVCTLTFNIQPFEAEPETPPGPAYAQTLQSIKARLQGEWEAEYGGFARLSAPRRLDLAGDSDLQPFDWWNNENGELIVGFDVSKSQVQELEEMISSEGGKITDTISIGENVRALTVEVPADYVYIFAERMRANELVKYVEPNSIAEALFTPNDPYWPSQWGPKKIEADSAWDTATGSSDVLVAIIDTGIDYTHSDLAANYVPLGYDWVNYDADPRDDHGHGTHCAGIVAAILNNSIGIAGLAQVRIMAEKVLDSEGHGYYSWIVDGIYHAIGKGAKIISMSLGGYDDSLMLHDAVKYAYDHGVLVIAAAGNDGGEVKLYPAVYDEVIAVSATNEVDNLATFSTYGPWIDLSAPGVDVYSTLLGNSYGYKSGTSMACPHVAGVAALAWSHFANYTIDEVWWLLERSADDLGDVGVDRYYGYGRVNARKAVIGLPEHDLRITGWQHRSRLDPGQQGVFNATVSNFGRNNETNISVEFLVNETLIDSASIGFLEVDDSKLVSFSWDTTTIGIYNVTCYVVPVPGENLTENNVVSSNVMVRFPTTLKVPQDYPTIKAAINSAGDGDTVLVGEGCYIEGQIDVPKDNITLVADGHAILDGQLGGYVLNIKANYIVIEGFDIQNGTSYGVDMKGCGNVLEGNTIHSGKGVNVHNSQNSLISLNNVTSDENGIILQYSSNCTVRQNNLVTRPWCGGLNIWKSSNNTISLNIITGEMKGVGLDLFYSENNLIVSNTIEGTEYGLVLRASPYNKLRNNIMTNNKRNFCVWKEDGVLTYSWQAVNDVDTSNTVDGKPIYYWINERDNTVPSDAGCVVLVYCENIKVENLNLKNNLDGILLVETHGTQIRRNNITENTGTPFELTCGGIVAMHGSSNNTIISNNITFNEQGIIVRHGSNNTISLNNIANNLMWGITLYAPSNMSINSNNITNNGSGVNLIGSACTISSNNIVQHEKYGLILSGSSNTAVSNNITKNGFSGISLNHLANSVVSLNNINENDGYSMWIYEASDNAIFHNNFVDNAKKIYSYQSVNTWDNSYPSGGNYWSDYSGTDAHKGLYQDQTGSDGIGDTPYVIAADNADNYPLMKPYSPHDIGITNITASKTVVGQGSDLNVTVKMLNYGVNAETFNVTTYANATVIQTKTVTLTSRNSTTVTFRWNTTGAAKGDYIMKAKATQVPGETDTEDNALTDEWVKVSMIGDVSGEPYGEGWGEINIYDVVTVTSRYGSKEGDDNWNPNADVSGEPYGMGWGKINIYDVVTVTSRYGQKDP